MIIDKSVGFWWLVGNCSYLQDIAYYLYIKDFDNYFHISKPISQYVFIMQHSYEKNTGYISQYYQQALSIIRKEKLEKLINDSTNKINKKIL